IQDGAVHAPGPQDALLFLQREPEDLVGRPQEACPYEPLPFLEDRPLREVEGPDDVVLGVLPQADPGAVDRDEPPHQPRLERAAARRPEAFEQAGRGPFRLLRAGPELAAVLPRGAAPEIPLDGRDELRRRLAPARPGGVDLARAPHAVPLEKRLEGV